MHAGSERHQTRGSRISQLLTRASKLVWQLVGCLLLFAAVQPPMSHAQVQVTSALNSGFVWEKVGTDDIPQELPNFGGFSVPAGKRIDANGRVTAVAVDPFVTGRIFLGTASGGLWCSTNGGSTFSSVSITATANAAVFSMGAITIDPKTSGVLYVGTGEGNASADSYYGQGVYKSTDGGNTWTKLGGTIFDQQAITKIAIDSTTGNLFVGVTQGHSANRAGAGVVEGFAVNDGLYRSTNGGGTFT